MKGETRRQVVALRDQAESEEDWQTVVDCEEALDTSDEERHREAMSRLRATLALLERLKGMP